MNLEQKKALGYQIKKHRERKNWTQEDLESKSGVNLRTIQRAEGGQGINSFNLGGIAEALNMDASELIRLAEKFGSPSPQKRISLKEVKSAQSLIGVLKRHIRHRWSLEVGLPDEHPYNEMIGEDIIELDSDLEPRQSPSKTKSHVCVAHSSFSACANKWDFAFSLAIMSRK